MTRFGRGFPFLNDDNVGDLLILCKMTDDEYHGYVLQNDDDIEDFLSAFNISVNDTNNLISKSNAADTATILKKCFADYISKTAADFPATIDLSNKARECYNRAYSINSEHIKSNPDDHLINWISTEYQLFKEFENNRYGRRIQSAFKSVEELVCFSNEILNRRKSRAGKSLEHHLSEIFKIVSIQFENQVITEQKKRTDFIFPGSGNYHDGSYPAGKLTFLAAKTTCKDRWRQILNEADRVKQKHLFTLQQGISKNQLDEMYASNVRLVVPKGYRDFFPKEYRTDIMSLDTFIFHVKAQQC